MALANFVSYTFGPLRKRAERAVIAPICQAPDFLMLGVKIFICRQNRRLNSPYKNWNSWFLNWIFIRKEEVEGGKKSLIQPIPFTLHTSPVMCHK